MENESLRQSFDIMIRKEYKKLVNYVRKNMENRYFDASPEDIIQDVAINLISRLDVNTQIENLTSYMYRSLRNKILDLRRKPRKSISIENFDDVKNSNSLLKMLIDEEEPEIPQYEPEMLHDAILRLNPAERELIMLTEFEGRRFDELSKEWEIPIGTLLSRKHRALSKLNKILVNKNKK